MNKKLSMAVAGAVLAMGASVASAGIIIPAGEWTVDLSGNVNGYYSYTKTSGTAASGSITGALPSGSHTSSVNTGLLPAALGVGAKSRQGDYDVGFQFTFFPGISSVGSYGADSALGMNSLNIRQAFLTFGDKSWGTIKIGRDLGIYESDAILSDITLLGAGTHFTQNGSTTLGRIGSGYLYADWKAQIQYATPNWSGFSAVGAIDTPWQAGGLSSFSASGGTNKDPGFEGKVQYEWAGDFGGKVWLGGIYQKVGGIGRAEGYDIGGKVGAAGFEVVGSYYAGEGIGKTGFLLDGFSNIDNARRDSSGGYIQGTYKIPGMGTKIGLSWGTSQLDTANAADAAVGRNSLIAEDRSWVVGVYHPLTKSVNLVAEYTDTKGEGQVGFHSKQRNLALGAILFF